MLRRGNRCGPDFLRGLVGDRSPLGVDNSRSQTPTCTHAVFSGLIGLRHRGAHLVCFSTRGHRPALLLAQFRRLSGTSASTAATTPAPSAAEAIPTPVPSLDGTRAPLRASQAPFVGSSAATEGEEAGSRWLDAAWEISVSDVAAVVVAALAAAGALVCRRRRRHAAARSQDAGEDRRP